MLFTNCLILKTITPSNRNLWYRQVEKGTIPIDLGFKQSVSYAGLVTFRHELRQRGRLLVVNEHPL